MYLVAAWGNVYRLPTNDQIADSSETDHFAVHRPDRAVSEFRLDINAFWILRGAGCFTIPIEHGLVVCISVVLVNGRKSATCEFEWSASA
jgi:hypothetical protein